MSRFAIFVGGTNAGWTREPGSLPPIIEMPERGDSVLDHPPVWDAPQVETIKRERYHRHDFVTSENVRYIYALDGMTDGEVLDALIDSYCDNYRR